jgi:hypothetical protein
MPQMQHLEAEMRPPGTLLYMHSSESRKRLPVRGNRRDAFRIDARWQWSLTILDTDQIRNTLLRTRRRLCIRPRAELVNQVARAHRLEVTFEMILRRDACTMVGPRVWTSPLRFVDAT